MKIFRKISITLISGIFLLTCLGPKEGLYPPPDHQYSKSIHVINLGWHSGVIFKRDNIDPVLWPAIQDFPDAEYIEVGWGDADFYQAEENTVWQGAKALFWPTSSVLHVVGMKRPPTEYFPGYQIIKIVLSDSGYNNLTRFMQDSYARDDSGAVIPIGRGLYGDSRFYQANGKYLFANNCNNWIAKGIRQAGCPITPAYGCTSGNVFYQLRKFGEDVGVKN